jgi:hypothetical protein
VEAVTRKRRRVNLPMCMYFPDARKRAGTRSSHPGIVPFEPGLIGFY